MLASKTFTNSNLVDGLLSWNHGLNTVNVIPAWKDNEGVYRTIGDLFKVVDKDNVILSCNSAIEGTHTLYLTYETAIRIVTSDANLLLSFSEQQLIRPMSTYNSTNTQAVNRYKQLAYEVEYYELDKLLGSAFYQDISKNPANYTDLLNGCSFVDRNDNTIEHRGLKYVIAYLNYAKYIGESYVNDTFTGLVQKTRPDSERISTGDIKRLQQEYREIAFNAFDLIREYLYINSEIYSLWKNERKKDMKTNKKFYGVNFRTICIFLIGLLSYNINAQSLSIARLPYKNIVQNFQGDTIWTKINGDTASIHTNLNFFNFDKPVLVNGDTIQGGSGTWSTDSANYAAKSLLNDSINALHNRTAVSQHIKPQDTTRWGTNSSPMIYPELGIPISTGSAWGTSLTNNSSDWNTAYGWGNHATAGYQLKSDTSSYDATQYWTNNQGFLKSYTETDPIYSTDSSYIKGNIRNLKAFTDTTAEWVSRTIYVSMPTDPQTPGSDITGTGLVDAPYATIYRALQSIKPGGMKGSARITIQLDSGSFDYSIKEKYLINELIKNGTIAGFYLQGQMVKESYPVFTLTSTASDFTRYTVSGTTFTNNELKDKFLALSSPLNYVPIVSNTSNTIYSIIPTTSYTNIYRCNTTLNCTGENNSFAIANTEFSFDSQSIPNRIIISQLLINMTGNYIEYVNYCLFYYSIITKSLANIRIPYSGLGMFSYCTIYLNPTSDNSVTIAGNPGSHLYMYATVIKSLSTTRRTFAVAPYIFTSNGGLWLSGFNYAFANSNASILDQSSQGAPIKITNCSNVIKCTSPSTSQLNMNISTLVLDSVDYFLYKTIEAPIKFTVSTLYGNVRLGLFNTSSTIKKITDIGTGSYINCPGIYSEYQQKISANLLNNSTDSISIGDKSYNRSIELTYNIVRGANYRSGKLKILNTGSALLFDPGDYIEIADIGVTLNGAYYSGSSNTIKLKWTTTNTGTAATFTYDAIRQNY
jgi:hypothetical protein